MEQSEFKAVFSSVEASDAFYLFLQQIFHLYPEDKFHYLIKEVSEIELDDASIYQKVQSRLHEIKPFMSELTFALPALKKQKKEMAQQVLQLLKNEKKVNGYLEIGSTGRYISELKKHIELSGKVYITNDIEPSNSLGDIFERGRWRKFGTFFQLDDYAPISEHLIPSDSIDLVTCHIGLHHCPEEKLMAYLASIFRILRKGGRFIIRDHDVKTEEMTTFVSLVHTVFNVGLAVSWDENNAEYRCFRSVDEWINLLEQAGFVMDAQRILQDKDPSLNTLFQCFKA